MAEVLVGRVPEGWEVLTLGEVCERGGGDIQTGPFGSQLHASDYVPTGIPSVMPQNIGDNVIVEDGIARIKPDDAKRLKRYLLAAGDIVYSRRGDVERRALVNSRQDGWLCGTGCLRVRPGSGADSRFLSYYLGHPEVRSYIVRHAIGATMRNLNTKLLSAVPVVLPPRPVQWLIGETLGAFDDKILVNRRIAGVARDLAQAQLLKSLKEGRSRNVQLADVVQVLTRGVAPQYTDALDGMIVLNQKCVRNGRVSLAPARRTLREKVPQEKLLQVNDVVVNSTGVGTLGRVARWMFDHQATADSHVTIIRFDPKQIDPICGGLAVLSIEHEIEMLGEGSTGQTELSRRKLGEMRIDVPIAEESDRLRPLLESLEEAGSKALRQNQLLAELRDSLLLKLISGELRVRNAEGIVEAAV